MSAVGSGFVVDVGAAAAVAVTVVVVEAVCPAASVIAAFTVVATVFPGATSCAVGVKITSFSAAATADDDPVRVSTPLAIWLPSVAAFGSDSVPLAVEFRLTFAVSV